ncbi:hypothetical protein CHRYSEOSP005_31120 [Chryseobacterium sp. Alg-005]|uniref:hypothetical protein n=1 Tax=Chryseobacterium sp. Alg-005 TaxID=3159516 RepID=UPI0035556F4B
MEKANPIHGIEFLIQITEDGRLNVWHIALLTAIVKLAYLQNETGVIRVSRSKLMYQAHIKNTATYHKYFKELQNFGYVKYTPCYHPGYRSTLELFDLENQIPEIIKKIDLQHLLV